MKATTGSDYTTMLVTGDNVTLSITQSAYVEFDLAVKDFEEGRVVDLDTALNEPPEDKP